MTYREAFERMQEPFKSLAIDNTPSEYLDTTPVTCPESQKISDYLHCAFVWSETPQEEFYWSKYYDTLTNLGL